MLQASRILLVTLPIFLSQGAALAQQLDEPPLPPPAPVAPQPPPPPPMVEPAAPPPPLLPDGAVMVPPPPPAAPMVRMPSPLPPQMYGRWRAGRAVYAVGSVFGLVGSGLSLTGLLVTGIYGPSTDNGQIGLSLIAGGAAATGVGVILNATGLGLQHSALASIGADPGRGLFGAGTAFGVLGLLGLGVGQFFRHTDYVSTPYAGFAASLGAAALLTVGGILYFADARRLMLTYRRLTTF